LRLCPFLLAFCAVAAQCTQPRRWRKRPSAAPVCDGAKLLIFAARLTAQFRIVSSVTILQQIVHPCSPAPAGTLRRAAGKTKRFAGMSPAEELGKRWRFFPTYAEV
jgi:hypothetical protein